MTEDIKKYRALMEQAFEAPMHTEAAPEEGLDMHNHEHVAQLLIDILKDSSPTTDELRGMVMGLKDMGHGAADIHKILDIAHQKIKGA